MADEYRIGRYTDGPNGSGYFTAGIDARLPDKYGKERWHYHAIEFHSKDKTVAECRRNVFFAALRLLISDCRDETADAFAQLCKELQKET